MKEVLKYLQAGAIVPVDMKTTALLVNALREALAQPAQEPVAGTKTWFEDGKVVTQYLTAKDIYKEPAQEPAIGDIRALKHRIHELEGEVIGYKRILDAQPAQEPVAWMHVQGDYEEPSWRQLDDDEIEMGWKQYPLYTTPPLRPWVGLTAEEAAECWTTSATQTWKNIESKLKEKNNGT